MARSFAGGTDLIKGSSATPINFNFNSTFSAGGWFWLNSLVAAQYSLYGHLDVSNSFRGWEIDWSNAVGGGTFDCFLINVYPTTAIEIGFSAAGVAANSWGHFLLTYDGSTSALGMKAYFNGVDISAGSSVQHNTLGSNVTTNAIPPVVGARTDNTQPLSGKTAETAAWNVVLTASEAAALGKGARPFNIRPSNLVHYWPIDGLQSPEPDFSGNVNNGTVTGTTKVLGPPVTMFTPRWPLISPTSPGATLFAQALM